MTEPATLPFQQTLAYIGASFLIIIAVVFLICVWSMLKEKIRTFIYNYQKSHLEGKQPTAKCYCEYCRYFKEDGVGGYLCRYSTTPVGPACFCWRADPISKEKYQCLKEREEDDG